MKNPSTIIFCLLTFLITCVVSVQVGLKKGRILGYEEANSQDQRMAFTRAKTLAEAAYRGELNQCKEWVDGLGADLARANSIIRGM